MFFHVHLVTASACAHQKIVWLNISVNEILVVEIFNATYHLEGKISTKMTKCLQTQCGANYTVTVASKSFKDNLPQVLINNLESVRVSVDTLSLVYIFSLMISIHFLGTDKENFFKNCELLKFVIVSFILMTLMYD